MELWIRGRIDIIQTTIQFESAKIITFWRTEDTCRHSDFNVKTANNNNNNNNNKIGRRRTGRDYPNCSITENGQNAEKSSEDLRRLTVTKTPVKKLFANTDVKKSKGVNNNNNDNARQQLHPILTTNHSQRYS